MELRDLLGGQPPPSARWSIAAVDVTSGAPLFGHDQARLLRTASVGKVFVLIELAAAVARGDVSLFRPVARGDTEPVLDSGIWHTMLADVLPAGDVARLVGAVSDNWATNALIELVGLDAVRERARQLAPGGSALHDYVRDQRLPGMPPTLSEGCAADWVSICARLERSELVGQEEDAMVRDWLGSGVDHSMVLSALSLDPLVHTDVTDETPVWNKTGTVDGVRADIGVVRGSARTVTYAVLCNWDPARAAVPEILAGMRSIGARLGAVLDQNENVF
jgi:beta-lactamase class A